MLEIVVHHTMTGPTCIHIQTAGGRELQIMEAASTVTAYDPQVTC